MPLPPAALLASSLFEAPRHVRSIEDLVHVPFLMWAVDACRPRRVVQWGVGGGTALLALCQAAQRHGPEIEVIGQVPVPAVGDGIEMDVPEDLVSTLGAAYPGCTLVPVPAAAAHAETVGRRPDLLVVRLGDIGADADRLDMLLAAVPERGLLVLLGAGAAGVDDVEGAFRSDEGEGLLAVAGARAPGPVREVVSLSPGSAEHAGARAVLSRLGRAALADHVLRGDRAPSQVAAPAETPGAVEALSERIAEIAGRARLAEERHVREIAAMTRIADTQGGRAWSEARIALKDAELDARRRRGRLALRGIETAMGQPPLRQQVRTVLRSDLFDARWYAARHEDLAAISGDARALADHYVRRGAVEGRAPGPGFDTRAYYVDNPDVAAAGHNALVHYEEFGRRERRAITPAEMSTPEADGSASGDAA